MTKQTPIPPNAIIDQNGCFSPLPSDEPVSENITARLSGERISYYLPERPITDEEVAAIQAHYATHGTTVKFFEAYSRFPVNQSKEVVMGKQKKKLRVRQKAARRTAARRIQQSRVQENWW